MHKRKESMANACAIRPFPPTGGTTDYVYIQPTVPEFQFCSLKKSSHCNEKRSAMPAELLHGHGQFPFPALSKYYGVSEKLIRYKY